MKILIYLLSLLILSNCTSMAVIPTKPSARVDQSLLDQENKDSNLTADQMREALTRSDKMTGFRDGLVVEATLLTKPLLRAQAIEYAKKEAYKKKQSKKEEKAAITKRMAGIDKEKNITCFIVGVQTNMGAAIQSKYWHGEISQGDQKADVKFSKFTGFTRNTRSAFQTGNTINVVNNRQHHLFSSACAKFEINKSKGDIVFLIEPRFEEGIKPMALTWVNSQPKKVEKAGCSSAVVKKPMKFGKLQLTCIDECTDRVHPLNQKKCQEQFERHLSKEK